MAKAATATATATAPAPKPDPSNGSLIMVKGLLQSPTAEAGTSVGDHARSQKLPAYSDKDLLVAIVPHNPKRQGTKCHADYELGMTAIGTKGCTVAKYKEVMEKGGRKSLIRAEISWQLRAGYWGLRRAK